VSKVDLTKAKEIINRLGMPALFTDVTFQRNSHSSTCTKEDWCVCDSDYPKDIALQGYHAPCVLNDHTACQVFLTTDTAYHFPRDIFIPQEDGTLPIDSSQYHLRELNPVQELLQYEKDTKSFGSPWLTTAAVLKLAERPVPWLWEPYLAPGALTVLYADTDAGKSTLICNLLNQMFAGETQFLGLPISPALVLYLMEDPPIALKWRTESKFFRTLRSSDHVRWFRQGTVVPGSDKGGHPIPVRVTEWNSESGPSYSSWVHEAIKQHRESALAHLPVLVIIDTITTFLGFEDGNSSTDVAGAMRELGLLADTTGAAILALHHARRPRDGKYRVNYMGSAQFKAQCEVFLSLQRQSSDRNNRQRSLELEKTRLSEHKDPLPLTLSDEKAYEIDPDPPKKSKGAGDYEKEERYREIWKADRALPGQSNRALAKTLQISDKTVRAALDYAEEHNWDEEETPDEA